MKYINIQNDKPESYQALLRRINEVKFVDDNGNFINMEKEKYA